MIHRDYIMRMMELFVRALAKICLLTEQRQYDEALAEIDRTGELFFGKDFKLYKILSEADLFRLLTSDGMLDANRCLVLAELLKAEGEILEDQNEVEASWSRYLRSLSLFLEAVLNNKLLETEENFSKIDILIKKTQNMDFPDAVRKKIALCNALQGRVGPKKDS
jgi:hypothetical protein